MQEKYFSLQQDGQMDFFSMAPEYAGQAEKRSNRKMETKLDIELVIAGRHTVLCQTIHCC